MDLKKFIFRFCYLLNYKYLFIVFFLQTLFFARLLSASPDYLTLQSRIVQPNGHNLEAASVNYRFSITDPVGTCVVYQEDFSNVSMVDSKGLVAIKIGSGTRGYPVAATTMKDIFTNFNSPVFNCQAGGTYTAASSDQRKIVMQFNDGSGWQTVPSLEINSTPFSLESLSAQKLGLFPAGDYVRSAQFATCVGGEAVHFNGTNFTCVTLGGAATSVAAAAGLAGTPSISFSGDTNTGLYSGAADTISISNNGSNTFNITSTALSSTTTGGATITQTNGTAAAPTFSFAGDADTGWYRAAADTLAASTVGAERIRIDSSGNVGIGTTLPTNPLTVKSSVGSTIRVENSTANPILTIGNENLGTGILSLNNATGIPKIVLRYDNALGSNIYSDGAGTNVGDGAGGNINGSGLAISAPYVVGQENGIVFTNSVQRGAAITGYTASTASYGIQGIRLKTNDGSGLTTRMSITEAGNVGVGTSDPVYGLDVRKEGAGGFVVGGGLLFNVYSSNAGFGGGSSIAGIGSIRTDNSVYGLLNVFNANGSKFHVRGDGNVGIGTTAPSVSLEIQAVNPGLTLRRSSNAADALIRMVPNGTVDANNPIYQFNQAGSGFNHFALQVNDGSTTSNALYVSRLGTVGIGGIPITKFHVASTSVGAAQTYVRAADDSGLGINPYVTAPGDGYKRFVDLIAWGDSVSSIASTFRFFTQDSSNNYGARMVIDGNGSVGIGTASPQTKLQVEGIISPATNNTYTLGNASYRFTEVYATNGVINTSDRREKKDIYSTDLGLDFINKLRPVSYRWNTGVDKDVHYGLIAQEAEQALVESGKMETTSIVTHDEGTDRYGVRYSELISPLIKAIQEFYSKFVAVESRQSHQDREIASLKAENTQLKTNDVANAQVIEKLKQENAGIKAYLCLKDKEASICK